MSASDPIDRTGSTTYSNDYLPVFLPVITYQAQFRPLTASASPQASGRGCDLTSTLHFYY